MTTPTSPPPPAPASDDTTAAPPAADRRRRRRRVRPGRPGRPAAAALVSVALLAAACGSDGGPGGGSDGDAAPGAEGGAAAAADAFPVEIEHAHGTTTIESPPERVVTVGLTDQDPVLALGVVPVGITDWFGDQPHAVWPWAQDLLGDAEPTVIDGSGEMADAEEIAALRPDLILAVYADLDEQQYDILSQIAPTVAQPGGYVGWGVPWQEQTRIIGTALGRADEAAALVADVEGRVDAARAEHPEFEGLTGVVATPYDGQVSIYAPQDTRGRLMAQLGFEPIDGLEEMAGDGFTAEISEERVDLLDVDALVWILGEDVQAGLDELHAQPVYGDLDVVTEGREVGVSNDGALGGATSFQTVLSIPALLDGLVPMLADAVDGDPATAVEIPG